MQQGRRERQSKIQWWNSHHWSDWLFCPRGPPTKKYYKLPLCPPHQSFPPQVTPTYKVLSREALKWEARGDCLGVRQDAAGSYLWEGICTHTELVVAILARTRSRWDRADLILCLEWGHSWVQNTWQVLPVLRSVLHCAGSRGSYSHHFSDATGLPPNRISLSLASEASGLHQSCCCFSKNCPEAAFVVQCTTQDRVGGVCSQVHHLVADDLPNWGKFQQRINTKPGFLRGLFHFALSSAAMSRSGELRGSQESTVRMMKGSKALG